MQTVGEILRATREKQGVSIKDVEQATSIRALYIQAIEDGNYNILPGEVYLKGFIRNYANFLGLDGQEMVAIYRQSQPSEQTNVEEPAKEARKTQSGAGGTSRKWLFVLVVVLLLGGVAWLAISFFSSQTPLPPTKPSPQTQIQPAQPLPPKTAPQSQPAPTTPGAKAVVISAKYSDQAWTQVTADGKQIFEGIPKVGETLTWNADKEITIRLGNAAGVDVTYNGQPQGKLGGDGEVIVKTFSANTMTTTPAKP